MNTCTPNAFRISLIGSSSVLLALCATALQSAQTPPAPALVATTYHVLRTFEVGGDGGWDYLNVDSESHRLFVSRSSHVMVIDVETGKVVGDIADTAGVHGIALAPEFGRGFTSNGKAGTSTVFDLKTLAPITTVKTGEGPDAIMYDAHTKRVFTMNGRGNDVTAIDAATATVVGTIPLGGKPEFAVSTGDGKVFVNIEDKSEVVCFDPKELKVLSRWPLAPGEEPSGLAIDLKNHRLFVGCANQKMIVLDSTSGRVLATLPIGQRVDANGFDAATGCAFSSNGEGTLTIVHEEDPATFKLLENVPTAVGAKTMALDPKTHLVYLGAAKYEAPAETKGEKRGRPAMIPGSFKILVVGK